MRRSSSSSKLLPLPLDLHVLGLPLAFILSQDQTLRCIKSYIFSSSTKTQIYLDGCFFVLVIIKKISSKNLFLNHSTAPLRRCFCGCKDKLFIFKTPNVFSFLFSSENSFSKHLKYRLERRSRFSRKRCKERAFYPTLPNKTQRKSK